MVPFLVIYFQDMQLKGIAILKELPPRLPHQKQMLSISNIQLTPAPSKSAGFFSHPLKPHNSFPIRSWNDLITHNSLHSLPPAPFHCVFRNSHSVMSKPAPKSPTSRALKVPWLACPNWNLAISRIPNPWGPLIRKVTVPSTSRQTGGTPH